MLVFVFMSVTNEEESNLYLLENFLVVNMDENTIMYWFSLS